MRTLDISPTDCEFKLPIYEEIQTDPLFRKISKHSVGFHVFRVSNDHIETVSRDEFGTFYDEEVYIVYASAIKGSFSDHSTITRDVKRHSIIERFIHVWLGAKSSAKKSKYAALKIIELDIYFSQSTTLYRETQGFESKRFLAYFKNYGLGILSGSHNESTTEFPQLYQIVDKTYPRSVQMTHINWSHFNSGYVMILKTIRIIFVWVGRSSSSIERIYALNVAKKFRDRPEIAVVHDGYEQSMSNDQKKEWNKLLNLKQRLVHPFVVEASSHNVPLKLYRCVNLNGILRAEHVKTDAIEQSDFTDKNFTFIIDGEAMGIWIWIGKHKNKEDRSEGMRYARGYVMKQDYPSHYPLCRVIDGHEPIDFISLFPQWFENGLGTASRQLIEKFDTLTLIQRPKLAASLQLIDDGSGETKVFQVENDTMKEVTKRYGQVFSSDQCYIVHYTTAFELSIKNVIYLWIGSQSKHKDKASGEFLMSEMFDQFYTDVVQISVYEGMEVPHFMQIFKGKLIILNGPNFKDGAQNINFALILKVSGNSTYTAKAVEVTYKTPYLPTSCYIIKTVSGMTWVWCGLSSTGDTREMAKNIACTVGEPNLIMEGAESSEFYESVGENCINQIKSVKHLIDPTSTIWDSKRVNLYMALLTQGKIRLEQIFTFDQSDLNPDNIYLLDAGSIIYVWFGKFKLKEKQAARLIALHFISIHPIPRKVTLSLAVIKQNYEPLSFTGFFPNWDPKIFKTWKTFEEIYQMNLPDDSQISFPRFASIGHSICNNEFDKYQKYPLEILRSEHFNLPTYINPSKKEVYLSHDDFVSVFKMEYSEFENLPKWRQTQLKKEYKLF